MRQILAAGVVCGAMATASVAQVFGGLEPGGNDQSFGLIVINQDYDEGFAEIEAVEQNLSGAYGFMQGLAIPASNVKLLMDGDRSEIEDAILELGSRMEDGARLIIYYYGLGLATEDDQDNLAVLSSLSIRETSEPFLVRRRLRRSTVPLETMVEDIGLTPAGQAFVIYDACSQPALTGSDDALYWSEIARQPCAPRPIEGADVLYGDPAVSQGTLLRAATSMLRSSPAMSIDGMDAGIKSILANEFEITGISATLLQPDPFAEGNLRCLALIDDGCTEAETPPEPVQEEPVEEVAEEGAEEETSEDVAAADEPVAEDEQTADASDAGEEDAPEAETSEGEPETETETETAEAETTETRAPTEAPARAGDFQAAWNTAREADICFGYLAYERDYVGSPFALKAKFAANRACTDDDRAAFAELPADAQIFEVAEPVTEESADEEVAEAPTEDATEEDATEDAQEAPEEDVADAETSEEGAEEGTEEDAQTAEAPTEEETGTEDETTDVAEAPETGEDATDEAPVEEVAETAEPPVRAVNAFAAWQTARREATCEGFLTYLRDFPGTAFSLKATDEADRLCTDEAREAFAALPAPGDEPVEEQVAETETETPEAPDEETVAEAPPEEETPPADETTEETPAEEPATETAEAETPEEPETPAGPIIPVRETAFAFAVVNDSYEEGGLPALDAEADLSAFLAIAARVGIPDENVKVLRNPSKITLEEEAFTFSLDMSSDADLLVYFAGHSVATLDDEQLMLPSDFVVPQSRQVRLAQRRFDENALHLKDLIRDLSEGSPRRMTLVYNACGPNVLPNDERKEPYWEFLSESSCVEKPLSGVSVLYPVTTDQVAVSPEDDEGNALTSPFMSVFLETIDENPSIGLTELGNTLAWKVPQATARLSLAAMDPVLVDDSRLTNSQKEGRCLAPQIVDGEEVCADLEGTVPTSEIEEDTSEDVVPVAQVPDEGTPADNTVEVTEAWVAVRQQDTCEAYQQFQADYPSSIFDALAVLRLEAVCGPPLPEYCVAAETPGGEPGLARDGYRRVQSKLNQVGCDVGGVDGIWGRGSQRGFDRLLSEANLSWDEDVPVCGTVERIEALGSARICPLVCGSGFRIENNRCVRIPTQTTTTTTSRPTTTTTTTTRPTTTTTTTTTRPTTTTTTTTRPAQTSCGPLEEPNGSGGCRPKRGLFGSGN